MNPFGHLSGVERRKSSSACIHIYSCTGFFLIGSYRKVCFGMIMPDICIRHHTIFSTITQYIIRINSKIKLELFQIDKVRDGSNFGLVINFNILSFNNSCVIADRIELVSDLNKSTFYNVFVVLL